MIRFNAKFYLCLGEKRKEPILMKKYQTFTGLFKLTKQRLQCVILFTSEDSYILDNVWYNCIIELPYAEKFPPYTIENAWPGSEPISVNKRYYLDGVKEPIGECELLSLYEIIWDNQKIAVDLDGFMRDDEKLIMEKNLDK